ncbi:hypothetical protein Ferp_0566 [Ferroglobus placidus DSM 10642]|uniref:Uncharacterized protein n=1 Tax=Ferroglobus placidus (strain DSM 10642 / AEDII12DO) TaxID=589924 RepID=D3S3A6_FERPA|nr:hypothetical protein [Ferroglobus placidus]ADC64739.1 hypothetical protein Ferp_0566 [Ferroglobus placidus DSM 10642]
MSKRGGSSRKRKSNNAQLAEKAFLYAEKAPVIAYPGWESALNCHFMDLIAHYRICEARWCINNEIATEYEAFTYLYTASLATPFDREWYRIYFHLFKKFYGHLLSKMDDWDEWDGGELSDYEKQLLIDLRKWIFKKQMRVLSQMQKQRQMRKQRQGKSEAEQEKGEGVETGEVRE